uniref:C2 domain-containing protein n=1 Tax=Leersia perrieri TaxID=77586 RepID=A0A0D9X496_9ORYZ
MFLCPHPSALHAASRTRRLGRLRPPRRSTAPPPRSNPRPLLTAPPPPCLTRSNVRRCHSSPDLRRPSRTHSRRSAPARPHRPCPAPIHSAPSPSLPSSRVAPHPPRAVADSVGDLLSSPPSLNPLRRAGVLLEAPSHLTRCRHAVHATSGAVTVLSRCIALRLPKWPYKYARQDRESPKSPYYVNSEKMSRGRDDAAKMAKLKLLLHRSENPLVEILMPMRYMNSFCHKATTSHIQILPRKNEKISSEVKIRVEEFLKPSLQIASHQCSDSGKHADSASHSVNSKSEVCSSVPKLQDFHLYFTLLSACSVTPSSILQIPDLYFRWVWLNVKVKGGTNLVTRDMSSSDILIISTNLLQNSPYLDCLQKAQTSVIKANLNPVWNEELKLYQVFDHDKLSKVDLMGEAKIDLQPMINTGTAFGD